MKKRVVSLVFACILVSLIMSGCTGNGTSTPSTSSSTDPSSNSSITYNGTEYSFYYGILGRNLNITYNDAAISEAKEYADMPIYPSNGYCKMIDDRVVVNLSN